jgi:hypothetical protein
VCKVLASAVLLATVAATLAVPPAQAAPVRNCGDMTSSFGTGDRNVTTRAVSCRYARRFVKRYRTSGCGNRCHFQGFTCRTRRTGVESIDTRCVQSSKVIRWQTAA